MDSNVFVDLSITDVSLVNKRNAVSAERCRCSLLFRVLKDGEIQTAKKSFGYTDSKLTPAHDCAAEAAAA